VKALRNIFALVPDCHAATGYYRQLWQRHFYAGLSKAVDVLVTPENVDFDWARTGRESASLPSSRATSSEILWRQVRQAHERFGLDAVLSYCYSRDIDPELVRRTIKLGVAWINFYCDSTHRFSEVEALAGVVSLNWFPEHAAIPKYQALRVPTACYAYAVNPDYLPDLTCRAMNHAVGFVGFPSANRITRLGYLRLMGCPVEIRGEGWVDEGADPFYNAVPRSRRLWRAATQSGAGEKIVRRLLWPLVRRQAKGSLSDEEFGEFVQQCQILLGLNQVRDATGHFRGYLKFRDIEFPGYGCCYLTEHNEDINNAFDVGREVLTYKTIREAARQIRELNRDPKRAARIGAAGRRRVLGEHTWDTRLKQLSQSLRGSR
jgi:hypothetical protein